MWILFSTTKLANKITFFKIYVDNFYILLIPIYCEEAVISV